MVGPASKVAIRHPLARLLELARWAPSGDNSQPWRFELVGSNSLVIWGKDTRDDVIYDRQGHASQLALGALLETLDIAASGLGLRVTGIDARALHDGRYRIGVTLDKEPSAVPDPLFDAIERRVTNRRPLSPAPLSESQKRGLENCLPEGYRAVWIEGWRGKWRAARLAWLNAGVRLTMPEAFSTHAAVIEWQATESMDRLPDRSLGLDPLTVRLMRWCLQDWNRVKFMNTWLAGTILPRIQMDLLPGLFCGAHFFLLANKVPATLDDYLRAGRAVQRFWLTATSLGLQLQPQYTPVVFQEYLADQVPFTGEAKILDGARAVVRGLQSFLGQDAGRCIYMGRLGAGNPPIARSTRLPLEDLIVTGWADDSDQSHSG